MSKLAVPKKSRKRSPNKGDSLELLINFRESEGKLWANRRAGIYLPLLLVVVVVLELLELLVPPLPTRFVSDW
jgi:hypothetical protein